MMPAPDVYPSISKEQTVALPESQPREGTTLNEAAGPSGAPHEVGAKVVCEATWDSMYHVAEVIDRRQGKSGPEYYIHYAEYNKRLDEWVPASRVEAWGSLAGGPAQKPGLAEKLAPLVIPGTPTAVVERLDTPGTGGDGRKLTRNLKRRYDEIYHVPKGVEELNPIDQTLEREHEEKTKVKNIQVVEFGKYEMDTWYYSPYPQPYANVEKLYICEFCLKYMRKAKTLKRHKTECKLKQPAGDEIYRTTTHHQQGGSAASRGPLQALSMFEVDGRKSKTYCQNLCLLAKLFLDHKTLYYDVDSFLFYILTEVDAFGYHLVGYFSKEKCSLEDYNLACILTLPPFQRKGYGRFLIAFAYELSKKEAKIGTPERPLSDLGQVSFRSYWTRVLLELLREHKGNLSIRDISNLTAIRQDDIISTLQSLNLIKYWKGQHIISVAPKIIDEHLRNVANRPHWIIDPTKLHWTPLASPPLKKGAR